MIGLGRALGIPWPGILKLPFRDVLMLSAYEQERILQEVPEGTEVVINTDPDDRPWGFECR